MNRNRKRLGGRKPGLVRPVDQKAPDLLERHAADQIVDVDAAIDGARRRLEAAGATVEVRVERGAPTATIHAHLVEASPDLVALGTRGLTGLRHLRLGSTASAVARTATCSVLVACDEQEYARSND